MSESDTNGTAAVSISDRDPSWTVLERVVQEHYGTEHVLVNLTEDAPGDVRLFPPGTRAFLIEHESRMCPHQPPCHWVCRIYCYQGRFTLITVEAMHRLSMHDLIDRVSGAVLHQG